MANQDTSSSLVPTKSSSQSDGSLIKASSISEKDKSITSIPPTYYNSQWFSRFPQVHYKEVPELDLESCLTAYTDAHSSFDLHSETIPPQSSPPPTAASKSKLSFLQRNWKFYTIQLDTYPYGRIAIAFGIMILLVIAFVAGLIRQIVSEAHNKLN